MQITDLTQTYIDTVIKEDNVTSYLESHPELFEHYFTYWASREHFKPTLTQEDTVGIRNRIFSRISHIEKQLQAQGVDTHSLELVLFVGSNCANGHSFKHNDKFVTWIAIESYDSIEKVDVFVTHEILHSVHYTARPEFYFSNKEEKESLGRQLVTEGLATYSVMRAMGISKERALWGDFLDEESLGVWMKKSEEAARELWRELCALSPLENIISSKELFLANDASNVRTFRLGYYLGVAIVEVCSNKKQHALTDVIETSKEDWALYMKDFCTSMK